MKPRLYFAVSALALAAIAAPASAQMRMPGMDMPAPRKSAAHKAPGKKAPVKKGPAQKAASAKAKPHALTPMAMPMEPAPAPVDHSQMRHDTMSMPAPSAPAEQKPMAMPMGGEQTNQPPMEGMSAEAMQHGEHGGTMAMNGALGSYPMERESSGTAWQPDRSTHQGLMSMSSEWMLMAHGVLNLVYDHQSGPRGGDKMFVSGMLMGMARHPLGNGTMQFKAMVSPEPLMGARGYPLLLASGETANGRDRLIDRQHPHDFFMELSGSVSQIIGPRSSIFLYAGLPGEPAFGPPAFMHREAIMDSPEAPISHHWLDSTHISFGVVTAGVVLDRVKLEVSRFNGREPDQHRGNIETGPLDSTSVRLSWNPTAELALQGSWGHFTDPEQLEPAVDQNRVSASLLYAREVAPGWKFAGTVAWGRKTTDHHGDDAFAAEASLKHGEWTLFGRGERTENRELIDVEHGRAYRVGKVSLGAIRDFRIADHLSLGAGGLLALNFVPNALAPLYGGHNPLGAMAFVRLRLK